MRNVVVYPAFSARYRHLAAYRAYIATLTNEPVADAPPPDRPEVVVSHAYVHWHDPDTVSVHPFKDTPLGDAA